MIKIQQLVNLASDTVLNCASAAGIGYLAARAFMSLNPVTAAVVSAVSVVVSKITNPIFDKIFAGEKANKASKLLGNVLNITASVAASAGIATALGYPVSMISFLGLNAITIGAFTAVTFGVFAVASVAAYIEGKHKHAAVPAPVANDVPAPVAG